MFNSMFFSLFGHKTLLSFNTYYDPAVMLCLKSSCWETLKQMFPRKFSTIKICILFYSFQPFCGHGSMLVPGQKRFGVVEMVAKTQKVALISCVECGQVSKYRQVKRGIRWYSGLQTANKMQVKLLFPGNNRIMQFKNSIWSKFSTVPPLKTQIYY